MKHRNDLQNLFRFLSSQEIALNDRQRKQFALYLELLEKWSHRQNLVSRKDVAHLVERHFLPSILLNNCLPGEIAGSLMDLGSGAGFPGVIIKILRPQVRVTLLDSSRKKTLFLEEVCERLVLDAVVVCERCENYGKSRQWKYEIVVARAVARLRTLLELASPVLVNGGRLFTIKGSDYKEEIDEVGDKGLGLMVYKPNADWLKYANYLKDKYVIDVEK